MSGGYVGMAHGNYGAGAGGAGAGAGGAWGAGGPGAGGVGATGGAAAWQADGGSAAWNAGGGAGGGAVVPGGIAAGGSMAGTGGCVVGSGGVPAGCATGCAGMGCATLSQGAMTYVGAGRGDYSVTTTYTYVGPGAGELSVVSRMQVLWARILGPLCCLLLLAALALALQQWMATTTTTSTSIQQAAVLPAKPEMGECTFWGDPHFKTFDGGRPSFYGEGEFYIVKSAQLSVQGRFKGTKYTKGLAATRKIAVGGALLNGHVIEVGCMEDGDVTVDGQAVLRNFPSSYEVPGVMGATITYNTDGTLVDGATDEFERHIIHVQLPSDVRLTVLRWNNYVDFRLSMRNTGDLDGACGNFNGSPSDDTTELVFQRDGARVQQSDLLFSHRTDVRLTDTVKKLLDICPPQQLEKAKTECQQEMSGALGGEVPEIQLKSCYLDVCFGSNEHALKMATQLGL